MATRRGLRATKRIEPQLDVLIEIEGEIVKAGGLYLKEDGGHFAATFLYAPQYLELARQGKAHSLDPLNLPLRATPFDTESRFYLLGALFDAAPDAWGRTVMAKDEGLSPVSLTESKVLLKGRGSGVGAILFAPAGSHVERPDGSDLPTLDQIEEIYQTVRAVETGAQVSEELRAMLMSSWDMGGARPKAVVRDDQGAEWIVKLPRSIDTYSRQRNEWANLEMARDIGIRVPETKLIDLDGDDCALLIRRFDRGEPGQMRRQHYLSAVSLVSPPPTFDKRNLDTPYGASIFSYARIASIIRAISGNVELDLMDLYARMIFNILVHNTDDHLKNTGFLLERGPRGYLYRLSPLFDVVTQENTLKHMLHIGPLAGREGTLENALAGAPDWRLRPQAAEEIIRRVQAVVARRRHYYDRAGMSAEEIGQVERWLGEHTPPMAHDVVETGEADPLLGTQTGERPRPRG